MLCRVLRVSTSGYYKNLKRKSRILLDSVVADKIHLIKTGFDQVLGYRRVTSALENAGMHVNHKKVLRIMRQSGQLSKIRRKKYSNYIPSSGDELCNIYENKLARKFKSTEYTGVWLQDVTEYKRCGKKLYLSTVYDSVAGKVLSYEYKDVQDTELVLSTLRSALNENKHEGVLVHSDRGYQYTSLKYRLLTQEFSVTPSMSASATPRDNAPMESFFSTLKTECLYYFKPKTIEEAKILIDDYIAYYNTTRLKNPCKQRTKTNKQPIPNANTVT